MINFKNEVVKLLTRQIILSRKQIEELVEIPPDKKLGDYAFPCFVLSSKLKENPVELAKILSTKIKLNDYVDKIEFKGPYLNFFINKTKLTELTLAEVLKKKKSYGQDNLGKKENIIVEFSSPNIAKPFSIAHLRSTVIGNALANIYSFLGYKTIRINHPGDWGTQFGALIVAFKKWGNMKELEKDPINYLLELYIRFHKEAEHQELTEKSSLLKEEARLWFKKLEHKDKTALKLWTLFTNTSLKEFQRIYDTLNVKFDYITGESFYDSKIKSTVKVLENSKLTELSDGALVVSLDKFNLPPCIIKKSDGASTYATRELAALFYRIKTFKPKKILYVVGSDQKMHFNQVFIVADLYGLNKEKFEHIPFGLIRLPEGKMSTRAGKIVLLDDVINKSVTLVKEIIEKKNPDLKNKERVAKEVGMGAIIFADLFNDRTNDLVFEWDKILDFEGDTGPYVQYSYARASSVLKKVEKLAEETDFSLLVQPVELELAGLISQFPEIVKEAAKLNKPSVIAKYSITLTKKFNEFYQNYPILKEYEELKNARLALTFAFKQTLGNSLYLLGIKTPEEM